MSSSSLPPRHSCPGVDPGDGYDSNTDDDDEKTCATTSPLPPRHSCPGVDPGDGYDSNTDDDDEKTCATTSPPPPVWIRAFPEDAGVGDDAGLRSPSTSAISPPLETNSEELPPDRIHHRWIANL